MSLKDEQNLTSLCANIYAETSAIYALHKNEMGDAALGYRVLYGPPLPRPSILFLGFNPGGDKEDADKGVAEGELNGWPEVCDYAVKTWKLARRLRAIWGAEFLEGTTGLNAVFFRSKSVADWRRLPNGLRLELEDFSNSRAEQIVRALAPERIVVIGLSTFDRLCAGTEVLAAEKRVLAKEGVIWGLPAQGVVHLSGAQISTADFGKVREYLRSGTIFPPVGCTLGADKLDPLTEYRSAEFHPEIWETDARSALCALEVASTGDFTEIIGGVISKNRPTLPSIVYSPTLLLFWSVVHAAGLACYNVATKGPDFRPKDLKWYVKANLPDLAAAASYLQSGERFAEGFWLNCLTNGVFAAMLRRLLSLREELPYRKSIMP